MSCQFAHDDGAYVLGAMSPAERLEYERHLAGCAECSRAVGELAGLPGLLGRVDASLLENPPVEDPVPETLLPALWRAVRRARRRRSLAVVGTSAAASVLVGVAAGQVLDGDGQVSAGTAPSSSATPSRAETVEMVPAREDVPVQARVSLEQVAWGTKLGLTCTYDRDSVEYQLPPEVDYTLFVMTRDGRTEQVGSWRSISGRAMRLTAATAAKREDIASVQVRAPGGLVVLALAP